MKRLTKAAILAIRGLGNTQKQELADVLGVSLKTLYRYIDNNNDNLTKAGVVDYLRAVTGLGDADLIENIEETADVKEL